MAPEPPVRILLRSFAERWLAVGSACAVPHGGDLISAFVFEVLAGANAAHLGYGSPESAVLAEAGPLAARLALLRPISGNAVAQSLSVPYETVRVRLLKMIAQDQVRRAPGGLLAIAAFEDRGPFGQARAGAHEAIVACLRELKAIGYDFAPHRDARRLAGPPSPDLVVRIIQGLLTASPSCSRRVSAACST